MKNLAEKWLKNTTSLLNQAIAKGGKEDLSSLTTAATPAVEPAGSLQGKNE
jgi:hypothetical protein